MKINGMRVVENIAKGVVFFLLITGFFVGAALLENASAEDASLSGLRIGGFGTLGASWDDNDDLTIFRDITQSPFDDNDVNATDWYWRLDSRIALQAEYRFSETVDMVIQGVLRHQADLNFMNSVETAFFRGRPFPTVDIRIGRLGYDAFLMSDTRNIGYAYLWVRPPTEFYGWTPIFSVDGADLTWHIDQGDVQWAVKAQGGQHRFEVGGSNYDFETDDLWSLSLSRQSGPLQLKVGHSRMTAENQAADGWPLLGGLDFFASATSELMPEVSEEARALQRELKLEGAKLRYSTIGMAYDNGMWVVQAELARGSSNVKALPESDIGYLGVGRRFGDMTPYMLFGYGRSVKDVRYPVSDWGVIAPEAAEIQNIALDLLNTTRIDQYTISLGVRWDFHNQAALKLQWDRTHIDAYGYALWWRDGNIMSVSSVVNLATVCVEYTF